MVYFKQTLLKCSFIFVIWNINNIGDFAACNSFNLGCFLYVNMDFKQLCKKLARMIIIKIDKIIFPFKMLMHMFHHS